MLMESYADRASLPASPRRLKPKISTVLVALWSKVSGRIGLFVTFNGFESEEMLPYRSITSWMLRRKTHLCWASRTSPCHASWARCVRAPWTTLWRWSYRGDSLRKTSCRFFPRTPVPVLWGPVAWKPGAAGYPQGYGAHQVHAEERQRDEKVRYKRGMGRTREIHSNVRLSESQTVSQLASLIYLFNKACHICAQL